MRFAVAIMKEAQRMIRLLTVLVISAISISLLGCSAEEDVVNFVLDPGIDNRLAWEAMNASIAEGSALLQSPDGVEPSQIRQKLTALKANTSYKLSLKVRAVRTPTAQLSLDLFVDETYDSPDQELLIPTLEIGPQYMAFHRIINTASFREQPYIRVFTFSTVPVEIDEIGITEVK